MRIDLFRPGTQTAMGGQTIDFTEELLTASAAAYDPALHEAPLVVGHPKTDDPAYGWVKALSFAEGEMAAEGDQVEPAFAELVQSGRYKKVSASFYPPAHASNPVPGVYYLKHVGFLGAVPPSLKGLKPVEFADDADVVTVELEFAENRAGQVARAMAEAWGRLRDWFIGKYGLEEADKAMSPWSEDWLRTIAAEVQAENASEGGPRFAEAFVALADRVCQIELAAPPEPEPKLDPAQAAAFAERENDLARREAAFAEQQAAARRKEDGLMLDGLVKAGRLAPGWKGQIAGFLERQDDVVEVSFAEGQEAETGRAFLLRLLGEAGVVIDFSERAPGSKGPPTQGDKTARLASRARQLVDDAAAAGRSLSYAEAVGRAEREEEPQ